MSIVPQLSALEAGFPAAMLSAVGTKESWRKEVHRPATSTHKWWAKRLGTVFRGVLTAALTPAEADAAKAYASDSRFEGAVVLDPFSGSGVTGVEAAKLGARPICFDINPVATLVQRQALQPWDEAALFAAFQVVEAEARAEVDRVHRTEDGRTVLYFFWVAVVDCPACDQSVRLFDSPVFAKHAYPSRHPKAQLVCPECLDLQEGRYDAASATCKNGHSFERSGAVQRATVTCGCGHSFKTTSALGDTPPRHEMYAKLVANPGGSKTYEPITEWDRLLYAECEALIAALGPDAVVPSGDLAPGNNTNQALRWNYTAWRDFFNARQLYSLSLIASAIRDLPGRSPERECLAALFSGTLEFNNLFASFKGEGTGAVRHMFANHILKPERTPLEAHPWGTSQSSGSFSTLFESRIRRAHSYKSRPADLVLRGIEVERTFELSAPLDRVLHDNWDDFSEDPDGAYVATRNAADTDVPDGSVDVIVTDPPFMDNVHYAELADFFHAWLGQMRPFEGYDDGVSTRRVGEVQHADATEFGLAIEAVWRECARVLKPGGLLAFTFHQARISGWIEVFDALSRAGFVVTAVQPVKGEMTTSVVKSAAREPSNLDSVVVCRRAIDGAATPHASIEEAIRSATASLVELKQNGIAVGRGDVRSVARGSALAYLASQGLPLRDLVQKVDDLASSAIVELDEASQVATAERSADQLQFFS